jgi:hypothetical protein
MTSEWKISLIYFVNYMPMTGFALPPMLLGMVIGRRLRMMFFINVLLYVPIN